MNEKALNRWTKDVANYDVPHQRLKQVALVIKNLGPKKYVDLGCAKGTLKTLAPEIKYVGIDFTPQDNSTFEFYRCDFNTQPLPEEINSSELICCSGLLEYIEDLPTFLKQINDKLIDNGRTVFTYFNMNHISRIIKLIKGSSFPVHPDWRGFYSSKDLQREINKAGFKVIEVIPTSQSFGVSKSVGGTLSEEIRLKKYNTFSGLMAHQFIYICEKK